LRLPTTLEQSFAKPTGVGTARMAENTDLTSQALAWWGWRAFSGTPGGA